MLATSERRPLPFHGGTTIVLVQKSHSNPFVLTGLLPARGVACLVLYHVAVPEFLNEFGSLEDKLGGPIVPGTSPGIPLLNGISDVTKQS